MIKTADTRNWMTVNSYRVRIAAFGLLAVPIGLHIFPRGYGTAIWALFVLQFLLYPHLMRWRNAAARDPARSERDNLVIDAVVSGVWSAGLGFPLWISVALFLASLLNHTVVRGFRGVAVCVVAFASGALASTTVIAFHVSTDTDGLVTLATIVGLTVYLSLMGIEFFTYIGKLHEVQAAVDSQKTTLEHANAALHLQIEQIHDLQEKLREQANRDSLTGLFNRRYLEGTLERELARCRREAVPLAMLMLDVDHFKQVNDKYGHQAGDEMLRVFGGLLQEHARAEDVVCRYGGEEFLLVMPKMPLEIARARAEHLCWVFRETKVVIGELQLSTTVSIGVAASPDHGGTVDELIRCADDALYQAKHNGRNRVVLYGDFRPGSEVKQP